jgi:hypothetical protein
MYISYQGRSYRNRVLNYIFKISNSKIKTYFFCVAKLNKIKQKRGEIYLTVSFGMSLLHRMKEENKWFM